MLYVVHGNGTEALASEGLIVGAFLMKSDADAFLLTLGNQPYVVSEVDNVWKHWMGIRDAIK
jgi:hypothetical protein